MPVLPEEWTKLELVFLADLETLVLEDELWGILPLLAPGLKPLGLSFQYNGSEQLKALHSLFNRSIVRTLELHNLNRSKSWFPFLLGPHKHIETLAFNLCSFFNDDLDNFLSGHSSLDTIPWPRLSTLHLSYCDVPIATMRRLLSLRSIKTLRLESCFIDGNRDFRTDAEIESFVTVISEVVPDTAWLHLLPKPFNSDWIDVSDVLLHKWWTCTACTKWHGPFSS